MITEKELYKKISWNRTNLNQLEMNYNIQIHTLRNYIDNNFLNLKKSNNFSSKQYAETILNIVKTTSNTDTSCVLNNIYYDSYDCLILFSMLELLGYKEFYILNRKLNDRTLKILMENNYNLEYEYDYDNIFVKITKHNS